MKFFIINLERVKDRKAYIEELCKGLKLDFEIIWAVDGASLSEAEIQKVSDESLSLKKLKRALNKGEIGCALSHKKCLEKMLELDLNEAVILEDDAFFDEKLLEFLKLKNHFPKELELLLLGHYKQVYPDDGFRIESPFSKRFDLKLDENHHLKRLVGGGNGTHAYYITQKGARKMNQALEKIILPYDHYTSDDDITNVYALYPVVVQTHEYFGTQTYVQEENSKRLRKRNLFSKYIKSFKNKLIFFIPSLKKLKKYEV